MGLAESAAAATTPTGSGGRVTGTIGRVKRHFSRELARSPSAPAHVSLACGGTQLDELKVKDKADLRDDNIPGKCLTNAAIREKDIEHGDEQRL